MYEYPRMVAVEMPHKDIWLKNFQCHGGATVIYGYWTAKIYEGS